jgi:homoserine O-succinyltransferase/O-acetyltransferase
MSWPIDRSIHCRFRRQIEKCIGQEYRRDVGRYFKGETDKYPSMPRSYFDRSMVDALTALQEKAICDRSGELLLEISNALGERTVANTWNSSATIV